MDSVVDEKVEEALNEDGRKNREVLTPEQKRDEDEMNSSLWGIIYNELEKDTDGSKNRVNKKASQRYTYDDLSTDADGNITVYAPVNFRMQSMLLKHMVLSSKLVLEAIGIRITRLLAPSTFPKDTVWKKQTKF